MGVIYWYFTFVCWLSQFRLISAQDFSVFLSERKPSPHLIERISSRKIKKECQRKRRMENVKQKEKRNNTDSKCRLHSN